MPRKVLGCDGVIAETTSSRDVDTAKPEPGIAQVVLDRAGVNSDQAVFVGDAVWDAHAAAGAGLPCIGVLSGGIAHAELQAAGPIFADPHDLLDHLESTRIAALAPPADRSQLHPTGTQHQRQHPPKKRKHGKRTGSRYEAHVATGYRGENDDGDPGQRGTEQRKPGVGAPVRRRHQHLHAMAPEQQAVHGDRRNEQYRCAHRKSHRRQIHHPHVFAENVKTLLERQREQESGEQLDPGLDHPQLLQQAVPISVEPFDLSFAAFPTIPALVILRMVDIHGRDHRTSRSVCGATLSAQPAMNWW